MKKQINWKLSKNVNVVKEQVKNSPDNLTKAFTSAANMLGSSESAVTQAWYKIIRNQRGTSFKTSSSEITKVNRKNSPRKELNQPIHQIVISSKIYDDVKIVTMKQYYTI